MVPENPLSVCLMMDSASLLQRYRLGYNPPLPLVLQDLKRVTVTPQKQPMPETPSDADLEAFFPLATKLPILNFQTGTSSFSSSIPLKVGIVLSGGPAPGGHNVISGLFDALKKLDPSSQLIGFLDGPGGIIKNKTIELTKEIIASYRNQGGFNCIGSGRTKIETPEQFDSVLKTLTFHQMDGLVIVGGDDSNTNAAFLAEFCSQKGLPTRIIGVPKTIDGDLKNSFIEVSFGFDTASKIYAEVIGNLLIDALSQKKYYFFVKMMGRSASHLTLECALKTRVNLALIGEEIACKGDSLAGVVDQIADLICARADQNKNYGVVLIPEGLLEFIPECQEMIGELNRLMAAESSKTGGNGLENLQSRMEQVKKQLSKASLDCFGRLPENIQVQMLLDRDPHGNIQLSKIETERLLITLVEKELMRRKQQGAYAGQFNPQPLFCGYEGRSGLPTNFDCNYCYSLGHVAALLVQQGASGYMCSIRNLAQPVESWEVSGIPIVKMLHFEMRKNKRQAVLKKALVDIEGPVFARFKQERAQWLLGDHYSCPGPIQFDGPREITDSVPLTLLLEKGR